MSSSAALTVLVRGDGSHAMRALNAVHGRMGELASSAARFTRAINGFSAASQMAAQLGGLYALKNIMQANLEFERRVLEMKQLADMTAAQAGAMRDFAVKRAGDLLATPQEIADGMRELANAGMKFEAISGTIEEAASAALAFRSSIRDVANMDFDLQTKMGLAPDRMRAMHEMLYYHAKSGRFEAKSLSQFAPEYLSAVSRVGVTGEAGTNFTAALLQSIQKIVAKDQPGEVVTMIKRGLGDIFSPHYTGLKGKKHGGQVSDEVVKGLKGYGIDIRKFMNAEQTGFAGEGGVAGVIGLVAAMRKAKLYKPLEAGMAGFRDEHVRNFWMQIMKDMPAIQENMHKAQEAQNQGVMAHDVDEVKNSNFGRLQRANAKMEASKTGKGATLATEFWANMVSWASDNPGQAAGVGAGLFTAWRLFKNRGQGAGFSGGGAGLAGGLAGAGAQHVFVTNWPGAAFGGGAGAVPAGAGAVNGGGMGTLIPTKAPSRLALADGRFGGGAAGAFKFGAPIALLAGGAEIYGVRGNEELNETQKNAQTGRVVAGTAGSLAGSVIGGGVGALFGGFGAVPGAVIGGVIGNAIGEWLVKDDVAAAMQKGEGEKREAALALQRQQLEATNQQTQAFNNFAVRPVQVVLPDGRVLAETVNNANGAQARRQ